MLLTNKMFCQGDGHSLENNGPLLTREPFLLVIRALDRLCSRQGFHSPLLYDNMYAPALYWKGLFIQSGILPKGGFIIINGNYFAQLFLWPEWCPVCLLYVLYVLCHFTHNLQKSPTKKFLICRESSAESSHKSLTKFSSLLTFYIAMELTVVF